MVREVVDCSSPSMRNIFHAFTTEVIDLYGVQFS